MISWHLDQYLRNPFFISLDEFTRYMQHDYARFNAHFPKVTTVEECREIFARVDTNHDNLIDFNEFARFLKQDVKGEFVVVLE